jgi:hypothetical protein
MSSSASNRTMLPVITNDASCIPIFPTCGIDIGDQIVRRGATSENIDIAVK